MEGLIKAGACGPELRWDERGVRVSVFYSPSPDRPAESLALYLMLDDDEPRQDVPVMEYARTRPGCWPTPRTSCVGWWPHSPTSRPVKSPRPSSPAAAPSRSCCRMAPPPVGRRASRPDAIPPAASLAPGRCTVGRGTGPPPLEHIFAAIWAVSLLLPAGVRALQVFDDLALGVLDRDGKTLDAILGEAGFDDVRPPLAS